MEISETEKGGIGGNYGRKIIEKGKGDAANIPSKR
jgi:hypothetical protein